MEKLKSYTPVYELYNGEDSMQVLTDYGNIYRFTYSNILPTNCDTLTRCGLLINAIFINDETDTAYFGKLEKNENGEYNEEKSKIYILE